MNKVILMGRLTREPEIRYSQGDNAMAIATFTLAVERRVSRNANNPNQQTADFPRCTAFGKNAEFAEKYLHQGTKICLVGRLQTGSYTKQDGTKVYTTDVVADELEFAESKAAADGYRNQARMSGGGANTGSVGGASHGAAASTGSMGADSLDGFMNIPDEVEDDLPFE